MRIKLKVILSYSTFIMLLLFVVSGLLYVRIGKPYPVSLITGSSMEPTLHRGDAVLWLPAKTEEVREGDIIVYKSSVYEGKLITHRVVRVYKAPDVYFETKGDQNDYTDQRGAHVPEHFITRKSFLGRIPVVSGTLIRLPGNMNPIFVSANAWDDLQQYIYSKPELGIYYLVGALSVISAVIVSYLLLRKQEPIPTLNDLIFGPEKVTIRRAFAYTVMGFVLFNVIATAFVYSSNTMSCGVNADAPAADIAFGNVKANTSHTKIYMVSNPNVLDTKIVVFWYGDIGRFISMEKRAFTLVPGEEHNQTINLDISHNAASGKYTGRIYAFSSPLWLMFPDWLIIYLTNADPMRGVLFLNILSSILVSLLITGALLCIEGIGRRFKLWHTSFTALRMVIKMPKLPKRRIVERGSLKAFVRHFTEMDWIDISMHKPFFAALVGLPFLLTGRPLIAVLPCAFVAGLIAYLMGCRFRAEVILAGILSEALIISVYALTFVWTFPLDETFMPALSYTTALMLVIFNLLFIPVCLLSYAGAHLTYAIRSRINPVINIIEYTDF